MLKSHNTPSGLITSFILAIVILTLTGCGAKFVPITLNPQIQPAGSTHQPNDVTIFIEKFTDDRRETYGIGERTKKVVGVAYTGMLNSPAFVTLEKDIEDVVTENIRSEFSRNGFNITQDRDSADLVLLGRINNFIVKELGAGNFTERSEAMVELDIALFDRKLDKKLWYDVKTCTPKKKYAGLKGDATSNDEIVINDAFSEVIASILNDTELMAAINGFAMSKQ